MNKEIGQCVQMCHMPANKSQALKPEEKLQPLPIQEWKWDHVTIDFITGLPMMRVQFV